MYTQAEADDTKLETIKTQLKITSKGGKSSQDVHKSLQENQD